MSAPATPARPLRVGLTGPIGCGKSTVAAILAEDGAMVIDADQLARQATEPGRPALAAIFERFGPAVRLPDGTLDRAALGRLVFTDPAELRALEAITHPAVRELLGSALALADGSGAPVVVLEAIRLVEGGYVGLLDELWLVICDPASQRARLADRGLAPAEAERRIASQAGLVERVRPVATRTIETSGALGDTRATVEMALAEALASASGRGAGRPDRASGPA